MSINKNYYDVLEVDRMATDEQINISFRRLALKFHPLRNPTNLATNTAKFNEICEAFDVLSEPERKALFDKYGEYGFKEGVPSKTGKIVGGYSFKGNSYEIFDSFFGSKSPWNDVLALDGSDQHSNMFGDSFGAQRQPLQDPPVDIEVDLECTLYELYNGAMKSIDIKREVLQHDGKTPKQQEVSLKIEVKPGYSEKTKLYYPSYGNERFGHKPSKLVVSVKQSQHESYIRKGDNLIYRHRIGLQQALVSEPIELKTLDGRVMNIALDQMITPQTTHLIKGEGMPICQEGSDDLQNHILSVKDTPKGDLYLSFDIVFPKKIFNEQKKQILTALEQNQQQLEQ